MKRRSVAILEWITGGGMLRQPVEAIPSSLLGEGKAMLGAIGSDWLGLGDWDLHHCWDSRLGESPLPSARIRRLSPSDDFLAEWMMIADQVDHVMVIAPEIDDSLSYAVERLRSCRASLINADGAFLQAASDKWLTAEALRRVSIAHPPTFLLSDVREFDRRQALARSHGGAWTIKARDGAGCDRVYRLGSLDEASQFAEQKLSDGFPWDRYLLQPWLEGDAGSIAVLCGATERCVLPPMAQAIEVASSSEGSPVCYRGGYGPWYDRSWLPKSAVEHFAKSVVAALPGQPLGWVGIDFVLAKVGAVERELVAIEINPRLTTSYLGLRKVLRENLAGLIGKLVSGAPLSYSLSGRTIAFDSFGMSPRIELD